MKKLTIKMKWISKIRSRIAHRIDKWATNRMLYRYSQFNDIQERWERFCLEQTKMLATRPRYKLEMDSWAIVHALSISHETRWKHDMSNWAIDRMKTVSTEDEWKEDLDKWAMERTFKIFETNEKERESIAIMFKHYYGPDYRNPVAGNIAKDIFTLELSRRTWGRIIEVKKAHNRHALAFITTPEGEFKFNLGRHWEKDLPEIGQEGVVLIGEIVN